MNISNEIQERLNKGESLDNIAASLTRALNEAVAAQKQKDSRHTNLVKAAEYLRKGILMIIKSEFPEMYDEANEGITSENLAKTLEDGLEEVRALHNLEKAFASPSKSKGIEDADKIIADFLTKNHL